MTCAVLFVVAYGGWGLDRWCEAQLLGTSGEKVMKSVLVALVAAAVLVGACRREVTYTPMKLGADVAGPSTIAQ
jgi:hypothetical protein